MAQPSYEKMVVHLRLLMSIAWQKGYQVGAQEHEVGKQHGPSITEEEIDEIIRLGEDAAKKKKERT